MIGPTSPVQKNDLFYPMGREQLGMALEVMADEIRPIRSAVFEYYKERLNRLKPTTVQKLATNIVKQIPFHDMNTERYYRLTLDFCVDRLISSSIDNAIINLSGQIKSSLNNTNIEKAIRGTISSKNFLRMFYNHLDQMYKVIVMDIVNSKIQELDPVSSNT